MHIIEELIAERATKLTAKPKLWKFIRPIVYKTLGYDLAVEMADNIANLSGKQAFKNVAKGLSLTTHITGAENIPPNGPCIIISNHPTGLADGIFVYDVLKHIRSDHKFLANADALRVIPNAEDIIIPVEWVKEKRTPAKTRATLRALKTAFLEEKAVVIFPSGALAKFSLRGLIDKEWNPTAFSMAKKHNIPIVPLRIKSRNSYLYYFVSLLNNELRDITLFHELLNKKGHRPKLVFGPKISANTLPRKTQEATTYVRTVVEKLG